MQLSFSVQKVLHLLYFQVLRAVNVRSTSASAAASPACTGVAASRGHGRRCTAASLCCLSAMISSKPQASSAAVPTERQVTYSIHVLLHMVCSYVNPAVGTVCRS